MENVVTALNAGAVAKSLAVYVGGVPESDFLTECVEEAQALVARLVSDNDVPGPIAKRAILEVGAELYHRKSAPNGIRSYADGFDGNSAIRVARDALVAARPLLAPYLPVAIS